MCDMKEEKRGYDEDLLARFRLPSVKFGSILHASSTNYTSFMLVS